jgi:hypothetical protein
MREVPGNSGSNIVEGVDDTVWQYRIYPGHAGWHDGDIWKSASLKRRGKTILVILWMIQSNGNFLKLSRSSNYHGAQSTNAGKRGCWIY